MRHTQRQMLLLAHSGHWSSLALYALPVVIVIGAIALSAVRQRRETALGEGGGEPGSDTHTEAS